MQGQYSVGLMVSVDGWPDASLWTWQGSAWAQDGRGEQATLQRPQRMRARDQVAG